jgi:hypothetical protein
MVPHFTGIIIEQQNLVRHVNYCHEPIYEVSSDIYFNVSYTDVWNSLRQTEAEKRISDLESQAAMDKKKILLGVDRTVSTLSTAGIDAIFLWRRRWLYINIWIQVKEVAIYLVTFVKSIEVQLGAFQLVISARDWLLRLQNCHVNRVNMLRIAEIRILLDGIDARRRIFLLGIRVVVINPEKIRM